MIKIPRCRFRAILSMNSRPYNTESSSKKKPYLSTTEKWMIISGLGLIGVAAGLTVAQYKESQKNAVDDLDAHEPQGIVTEKVYMDVSVAGGPPSRLVIGLYGEDCPITVRNFLSLCRGDSPSPVGPGPLSYKGCEFHRVIPGFMAQSGDVTNNNGTGGRSIYGVPFRDESFVFSHSTFALSMANSGPHTNSSQFFLTLAPTPWLDGKHVVFGHLLYGGTVLREIEKGGSRGGKVSIGNRAVITDCGVLPRPSPLLPAHQTAGIRKAGAPE
mmetsp:Transcript_33311/g.33920  ORF Transcript_33311/g.33920 Transcript_33311/m.33920 type:complete len:271 (+) Transcript_33311:331-1143(+)|eukprot:CAMPEP_0182433404 /NCGR_PEP_ID=MMETSP1167-20130531/62991_1 /TAXON_ID=2988 /ORGANISM="Mallomonas Sp, Strain CCMP3275" /LENGTH=270 /DNA_ID=CAMNT_0024622063 /DNA_START=270 /DNA_END=1082 /DNA_ORIENTATION=+